MIPRLRPDLRFADLAVLWPRFWRSTATQVAAFERDFAILAGQKEAVAFAYGRTAQMALLEALALKEQGREEVICPAYTCVVVAHAIVSSGLVPVFVDSEAGGYNMDWALVERATGAQTGAVIATSIFGEPANLEAINAYRARHPDVVILQDCAHSFFATGADGSYVQREGRAAFYGMNISKLMTSIFGGMVTTDDAALAQRVRKVRAQRSTPSGGRQSFLRGLYLLAAYIAFLSPVYGIIHWLERRGLLDAFVRYYDPAVIDLPGDVWAEMSAVQARLGIIQCRRYPSIIAHRRAIAAIYLAALKDIPGLRLPAAPEGATWSHFVIATDAAPEIIAHCRRQGVQLGELIDYEIPDMPSYQQARYVGERRSRRYPGHVINLPLHGGVNAKTAARIAAMVRETQLNSLEPRDLSSQSIQIGTSSELSLEMITALQALHRAALPDDIMPNVLPRYYRSTLNIMANTSDGVLFLAQINHRPLGLCFLTLDAKSVNRQMRRDFFGFATSLLRLLFVKPELFMEILVAICEPAKASKKEKNAEIFILCVAPEYQSAGIGGKLIECATKTLKEKGVYSLIARTSNARALSFYQGKGFQKISDQKRWKRSFAVLKRDLNITP